MEHAAGSDDSKIVGVGKKANTMQAPLIEPPLKHVCYISSGDSSDEPLADDLMDLTAGQKNQADMFIADVGSVSDDDIGSEDSLDRYCSGDNYGKDTLEEWAELPAEEKAKINNKFMDFMQVAAAHACPSQKLEDFQVLIANSWGTGSLEDYLFTFKAKGSVDGKVHYYETKFQRFYDYKNRSPDHFWTDTLLFVHPKDENELGTPPVRRT